MGVRRAAVWRVGPGWWAVDALDITSSPWRHPRAIMPVRIYPADRTEEFDSHAEAIDWADRWVYGPVYTWEHESWGRIRGHIDDVAGTWIRVRLVEPLDAVSQISGTPLRAGRGEMETFLTHRMTEIEEEAR